MINRSIVGSFAASALIHIALLPGASTLIRGKPGELATAPLILVNVAAVEEIKANAPPPLPTPTPITKPPKITPPKLLSRAELFETKQPAKVEQPKEEIKEQVNALPALPQFTSMPSDLGLAKTNSNLAGKSADGEAVGAGVGKLLDAGVIGGSGQSATSPGRGAKGDGNAGAESLSGLARPLGAYQVKPRYPEAARRAGSQGTTLLKFHVLANGRVSDITIEQSSGHRDLDNAAVDAVRKWLFEPARMGTEPVASEVILPVIFQLQR